MRYRTDNGEAGTNAGRPVPWSLQAPSAVAVGCLSCQGFPRLRATEVLCLPLMGGHRQVLVLLMLLLCPPLFSVPVTCMLHLFAVAPQFLDAFIPFSLFFHCFSL